MTNAFPSAVEIERDVSALSAFKTPAKSAYFLNVHSTADLSHLSKAVALAKSLGLPVVYLGDGTNCLFAFDQFPGLLVKNTLSGFQYLQNPPSPLAPRAVATERFEVYSAEKVHAVSLLLATQGFLGLIPWIGLPGSFGGAVVGNAGCFGLETADVLVSANVWNVVESTMETVSKAEMGFAYRTSVLKHSIDRFVVSAVFDLSLRKPGNVYETMKVCEFRNLRKNKQPAGRTCGSFFQNPPGYSAGALIDTAGLKGAKSGGAEISPLHANFFLASAHANWRDVLALRDLAKNQVLSKFGVQLVEEARIITENG